ncbi:MAG: acetyl-CoA carboxylase biotin carboxyl carrier protein [Proteobacteria bacterium]|nr:acetyl-CoA carboxylase biotin carboxyl carrier protein [Pseudomonadota bacterium]
MKKLEIDVELIHRLAALLDETGLSEIELGDGDSRVRVVRNSAGPSPAVKAGNPAPAAATPEPAVDADDPGAVNSPMVGTVFVAPEPGAEPFVSVGDDVAEGQTLFVIEAMKVMNPIKAPRAGTVTRILVSNGDPVEYGEALLILG